MSPGQPSGSLDSTRYSFPGRFGVTGKCRKRSPAHLPEDPCLRRLKLLFDAHLTPSGTLPLNIHPEKAQGL